jgi:hypothetical protein
MPEAADREPVVAARHPDPGRELVVDFDHFDGFDRKADAGREGDEVVDRHRERRHRQDAVER